MSALILFLAVFGTVFCLGFQSLNVNAGHYGLAALTSAVIGCCNLLQLKLVMTAQSPLEIVAYVVAGPLAIVSSMLLHRKVVQPYLTHHSQVVGTKVSPSDND